MCTVSMVGDTYADRWRYIRTVPPFTETGTSTTLVLPSPITREEFDALKAEVEEMRELLIAAKRIDELTGQPDCEMEEKVAVLRRVAELVGVDLEGIL